jgi:hypothetical protein
MTTKLHFVNKEGNISCHFYLTDWERNLPDVSFSLPGEYAASLIHSFEESGALV